MFIFLVLFLWQIVFSTKIRVMVLQALLMAVWRRKPKRTVSIYSDQGSQFTSQEW